MFNIINAENSDDFFKPLNERSSKGVFFYRFIGYDDEKSFSVFLKKYYISAKNKGIYINKTLLNPLEEQVNNFYKEINLNNFMNKNEIYNHCLKWLKTSNQNGLNLLSDSIYNMLQYLKQNGVSEGILKNTYIKFMCWFRYNFIEVINYLADNNLPKILYEGDITKYEVYVLKVLSYSGCDVLYLNFISDESYLKYDNESKFSTPVYGKIKADLKNCFKDENIKKNNINYNSKTQLLNSNINIKVETNKWIKKNFLDSIFDSNSQRGTEKDKIYNIFIRYIGYDDKNLYLNRLYNLKLNLNKSNKNYVIIDKKIQNPTIEEVYVVKSISVNNTNKKSIISSLLCGIDFISNSSLKALLKNAFIEYMESLSDTNSTMLYNRGVHMLCWIKRYYPLFQNYNFELQPIFIYYGVCSAIEAEFLCLLSFAGFDIIYISSDVETDKIFSGLNISKNSKLEVLEFSMEIIPYPQKEIKIKKPTTAYNAERELDSILYNGTGLFRNKQFKLSEAVTLKTTYEEIKILWKEPAKYRPSFESDDNKVIVPNLFVKISGVKDGNLEKYFDSIAEMITDKTFIINQTPYVKENKSNINIYNKNFIENKNINVNEIKKSKLYKYGYLNDRTQDLIFNKIQDLINLNLLKCDDMNLDYIIVNTLLNIDKIILQLIQNFDFTQQIPKLLLIDSGEEMFSINDCIIFLFLNLIGFDIALFTPTGYKDIETYIDENIFELHEIGEYMYNVIIPNLFMRKEKSNTFINKLFGKRRD